MRTFTEKRSYYYPFGLTMQGISSKAAGSLTNRYKFNGIEQNNDFDLNMYDAFYRNLDPQLGRFWQIDPKLESAEGWSPYSAMLNNPIRYADPLGDSTIKPINIPLNVNRNTSESTCQGCAARNLNMQIGPNRTVKASEPLISLTVSAGAQAGVKVGGIGAEVNAGSKELVSVSDQGVKPGNLNETKSGMELTAGVMSVGGESTTSTKSVTVNTVVGPQTYDQTTTTNTYSASVGIPKTPLQVKTQREQAYTQFTRNGITTAPVLVSDSRSQSGTGSYMPSRSVGSGNTKVAVSLFIKLELSVNIPGLFGSIRN